jgi:hypothetical protein
LHFHPKVAKHLQDIRMQVSVIDDHEIRTMFEEGSLDRSTLIIDEKKAVPAFPDQMHEKEGFA